MREIEFSVNPHSGELVVRGADPALLTTLASHLGGTVDLDCGQCPPPEAGVQFLATAEAPSQVGVAGFLHQSMVDGPGLRSVVFFQGCSRGCKGCANRHAQEFKGGTRLSVGSVLAEVLRRDQPRDGVTISGGEPLAQAKACAELVSRLKAEGTHVMVYTGYTFEHLAPFTNAAVQEVMALADVLVDGAYLAALHEEGLAFRGSSNQRVIDLSATRSTGELRLLHVD